MAGKRFARLLALQHERPVKAAKAAQSANYFGIHLYVPPHCHLYFSSSFFPDASVVIRQLPSVQQLRKSQAQR